jgi:hypothetical protein
MAKIMIQQNILLRQHHYPSVEDAHDVPPVEDQNLNPSVEDAHDAPPVEDNFDIDEGASASQNRRATKNDIISQRQGATYRDENSLATCDATYCRRKFNSTKGFLCCVINCNKNLHSRSPCSQKLNATDYVCAEHYDEYVSYNLK